MKKVLIFLALPLLFMAESCSKFTEGYGDSPNNPTIATPPLILSSAELGLYASYTGTLARISAILTQQAGGVQAQMLEIDQYQLLNTAYTNDWNNLYNNVVQPANDLIQNYGATNQQYAAVMKIMKVMALGVATDIWGDVPASEAGLGNITGNQTPKFDSQESIYAYLQTLLSEAITTLDAADGTNNYTIGSDDFIFNGDLKKWKNTAYMLKARFANRLSKGDATGSATTTLGFLANVTNAGDAMANYGTVTAEMNQWNAFNADRKNYIKAGKFLVDLMQTDADPRLPYYATATTGGTYVGAAPSSENIAASNIGSYIAGAGAPIPLVTYTEALFTKADANLRLGKTSEAAANYNEAVIRAVTQVTGSAPSATYIAAHASATAATITQEMIATQKYIALFTQIEAWAEWRRTGYPVLTPNPNNVTGTSAIPRRLPTENNELLYNKANAINVTDIFAKVWWDAL
ncbi:SusD/RagB family nutrient-binding outer membrane lipoprotein [Chitinophaga sancti]|uniref:Starch-binding associating with outer membrane n=1 Tax=Chitinophaga sancti TaxID=1004 RepID=A0A1K1NUY6_9BACT|nr:SusD/RagB family nutrient-binding outer membrane lipoprotein [Chitinophaga sancti]WQD60197.1 SusD/RagB family nutrient-binding outer membrane lipoprotein [Chitinophaga sancti]WQG87675.1 SusD/RagB family nutrient-binding outer membrane lipoprotein [Chitinophaga sancti]SFW39089.1 Starch-binding associating with outer membrane [Chitinophaga sancti]